MIYYFIMKTSIIFKLRSMTPAAADRILSGCGIFLAVTEAYKQLFLYFSINNRSYDWWFFPFQLCSLPMYFCLLLPVLPDCRLKTSLCTFMQDYGLLGGIAALIVPEGFCHIHWTLTIHGYLWHILLILISLFICLTGHSDLSLRGFTDTIPVFAVCCCIACAVNLLAPGRGRADMFYISPYYPNTQIVFHDLALCLGIHPANLLYLLSIVAGGAVLHRLLALSGRRLCTFPASDSGQMSQKKGSESAV